MKMTTSVDEFIAKAKANGASEEALVGMLTARGWPEKEVYEALAAHYEHVTGMEIPRRGGSGTAAKDAFFYLLIFSTLGTWVFGTGALMFALIERWFPDPLFSQVYAQAMYRSAVAFSMAMILVAFPIFLLVSRVVLRDEDAHPEKLQSPVRKWLTYMVLVITASIVIGDLVSCLFYALRGELTSRVLSKSLVVLLLSGGVFYYYFGGLRQSEEPRTAGQWSRDRWMAGISAAVVLLVVVLGFTNSGTPGMQRELRADEKRVRDLYEVSQKIYMQYAPAQKLPQRLEDLRDLSLSDPVTRQTYEYLTHEGSQYELCAAFSLSSDQDENMPRPSDWQHPSGRHCFALDATRQADGHIPFVMD